jgi:hypothetical protein
LLLYLELDFKSVKVSNPAAAAQQGKYKSLLLLLLLLYVCAGLWAGRCTTNKTRRGCARSLPVKLPELLNE